jgi:hypothetical protein
MDQLGCGENDLRGVFVVAHFLTASPPRDGRRYSEPRKRCPTRRRHRVMKWGKRWKRSRMLVASRVVDYVL